MSEGSTRRKGDGNDPPPPGPTTDSDRPTSGERHVRIAAFSAVDLSLPHGNALHLRGLLDALSGSGHSVTLVTPRAMGVAPSTLFNQIQIRRLGWRILTLLSFEVIGGLRLQSFCRRNRPDVIYLRHDLYAFSAAVVARRLRIPLVVEVNASVTEELAIEGHRFARRIAAFCESFTLRRANRVLVLAPAHGEDVVRRTGIAADRLRVVPIGTHLPARTDPETLRRDLGISPSTFVIGFAGNLSRIQGVETLIDAVLRIPSPEVLLLVIGCGEEEARLRGQGAGSADRIRFFGGVPREQSDSLLAVCQILVAPYRRPDYDRVSGGGALSSKILTYLAVDRPILISDIPSYRWLSEIGAGESFTAWDPIALARAIESSLARWSAAGCPLRDWPWSAPGPGRRFVEAGRTWDLIASRVAQILKELRRHPDP